MKAEPVVRRGAKPVPRRHVLRDATPCLAGLGGGLLGAGIADRPNNKMIARSLPIPRALPDG